MRPLLRRVLLTGDAVGGVWQYSLDLARGLAESGVEPVLAVLGPAPRAHQREEAATIEGLRLVPTALPLDWTARDLRAVRGAAETLAGLAARIGADTVHLHTPALAAEAPWPVPVVAVAHSCVGTWWAAVRRVALPEDLAWRAGQVAKGLAEADAVIAPSRSFAAALTRHYRPGRSIVVVPNGRRPASAASGERETSVLTAGRLWDEGKNIAMLDATVETLGVPVRAAGPVEGPNGAAITLRHLEWLGVLAPQTLADRMARTRVFVAPSLYEPFGLAVLEAAQSGMALALADIPTFRELWEGAAMFFRPDDPAGLRDVLRRLLQSPQRYADWAAERARSYTLERMVAATLDVHHALVGGMRETA